MKKILLLLIVILVSSLTACQERPTENETTIIDDVETNLDVPSEVTSETSLPSQINGVDIAWHTNISGTLNNNTIIQSDIDQPITLTAVLTHDTKTRYKYFDVVVLLNPDLVTVTEPNDNDTFTGYYTLLNDVSDANLKTALHDLIDDHTVLDYGDLWTALADSDEDPNNPQNVILFYSGTPRSELLHGGDQDDWNREHVWPKSHGDFDTNDVMGTDMHHIRPTDVSVNGYRGNLDFDIGGTLVDETTDCYRDGDSFEPRDEVKGDVARMLFYMAVRYEGDLFDEIDLELNNQVSNSGPYVGKLSVLLDWHQADPVDDFEMRRNDIIFSYQGNRNPFIDHPDLVARLFQ